MKNAGFNIKQRFLWQWEGNSVIEFPILYAKVFISNKGFYKSRKETHGIELVNLDIERSPNTIAEKSQPWKKYCSAKHRDAGFKVKISYRLFQSTEQRKFQLDLLLKGNASLFSSGAFEKNWKRLIFSQNHSNIYLLSSHWTLHRQYSVKIAVSFFQNQ